MELPATPYLQVLGLSSSTFQKNPFTAPFYLILHFFVTTPRGQIAFQL